MNVIYLKNVLPMETFSRPGTIWTGYIYVIFKYIHTSHKTQYFSPYVSSVVAVSQFNQASSVILVSRRFMIFETFIYLASPRLNGIGFHSPFLFMCEPMKWVIITFSDIILIPSNHFPGHDSGSSR